MPILYNITQIVYIDHIEKKVYYESDIEIDLKNGTLFYCKLTQLK